MQVWGLNVLVCVGVGTAPGGGLMQTLCNTLRTASPRIRAVALQALQALIGPLIYANYMPQGTMRHRVQKEAP